MPFSRPTILAVLTLGAAVLLGSVPEDGSEPPVERARTLRAEGRDAEAEQVLLAALTSLPEGARAEALGLLGRMALAKNQLERARELLERSAAGGIAQGLHRIALDASITLIYLESEHAHDLARAEAALARARTLGGGDAPAQARLSYMEALVAYRKRDVRVTLRRLAEVRRLAQGAPRESLFRDATHLMASTLASVGRLDAALALLDELASQATDLSACAHSDLLSSRGWFAWLSLQGPGRTAAVRSQRLAQMSRDFATAQALAERCGEAWPVRNGWLNRGFGALAYGHVDEARDALVRARRGAQVNDPRLAAWELELEGRIALLGGELALAQHTFEGALALGRASGLPDVAFRAQLGLGRTQLAAGRLRESEASFRAADALVERLFLSVPLSAGLSAFFADRDASTRGLLEVLLARGKRGEALRAAASRSPAGSPWRAVRAAPRARR